MFGGAFPRGGEFEDGTRMDFDFVWTDALFKDPKEPVVRTGGGLSG